MLDSKKREQLILVLLPALVIGLLYALFVFRVQLRSYRVAQQQLADSEKIAASDHDKLIARTKAEVAKQKRDEMRVKIESTKSRLEELAGSFGRSSRQFEIINQITRLMQRNDLALVSQETIDKPKLSVYQKQMLDDIDQWNGDQKLDYCQLQFEGRYGDVMRLLDQLDQAQVRSLPLSIDLKPSPTDDGKHSWTLVVVM